MNNKITVVDAVKLLEELDMPQNLLNHERKKVASEISTNPEWDYYVANQLDTLRTLVLVDKKYETDEIRGMMIALTMAHRFFKSCRSEALKHK